MTNRAFWRAIHSLAHPVTALAVIALLLNDHLLRVHWPSWWTGKLGDASWLVFAPFILAAAVAWLVPPRSKHQESIVGGLSILLIGVWFALAKITPAVHHLTTRVLDNLVGWHGTLGMDPTDLIMLPVLGISWLIWQRAPNTSLNLSPLVWIIAAIGMMGTLATSSPTPEIGIHGLCQEGEVVLALSIYQTFVSRDGGITWETIPFSYEIAECSQQKITNSHPSEADRTAWLLTHHEQTYRLVPGQGIYSYQSDGVEKLEIDLSEIGHDIRRVYYNDHERHNGLPYRWVFKPGPIDAIIDSRTRNLIVAMGLDGVLTRMPDGTWQWVAVGDFHYIDVTQQNPLMVLKPELTMALLLLMLLPPTLTNFNRSTSSTFFIGLVVSWLLWIPMSMAGDMFTYSPSGIFAIPVVLFGSLVLLLNLVVVKIYWSEHRGVFPLLALAALSMLTVILVFLPFIGWVRGTIPNHGTAVMFAFLLGLTGFVSSVLYMKVYFPAEKRKRKLKDEEATFSD